MANDSHAHVPDRGQVQLSQDDAQSSGQHYSEPGGHGPGLEAVDALEGASVGDWGYGPSRHSLAAATLAGFDAASAVGPAAVAGWRLAGFGVVAADSAKGWRLGAVAADSATGWQLASVAGVSDVASASAGVSAVASASAGVSAVASASAVVSAVASASAGVSAVASAGASAGAAWAGGLRPLRPRALRLPRGCCTCYCVRSDYIFFRQSSVKCLPCMDHAIIEDMCVRSQALRMPP